MFSFKNSVQVKVLLVLVKLFLVLGVSLVAVLALDVAYRQKFEVAYHRPGNLWPKPKTGQPYELVLLGNSHSESGVTFEKYHTKALNLSGVAQRFEFDLARLKHHAHEIAPGAVILINASPISFSHTNVNAKKGFQGGYYGRVAPWLIPYLDWGDYIEREFLPFTRSGYEWRQKIQTQIKERVSAEEKARYEAEFVSTEVAENEKTDAEDLNATFDSSSSESNQQVLSVPAAEVPFVVEYIESQLAAAVFDPGKLEDSANFIYQKWYHTDEFSPEFFEDNQRDLEKILQLAQRRGWRPVVITIPISTELQDTLLDDYLDTYLYQQLAQMSLEEKGVPYWDFTTQPPISNHSEWYDNSDHLNDTGAAVFSYVLLRKLIDQGLLAPSADGYYYQPLYVDAETLNITVSDYVESQQLKETK